MTHLSTGAYWVCQCVKDWGAFIGAYKTAGMWDTEFTMIKSNYIVTHFILQHSYYSLFPYNIQICCLLVHFPCWDHIENAWLIPISTSSSWRKTDYNDITLEACHYVATSIWVLYNLQPDQASTWHRCQTGSPLKNADALLKNNTNAILLPFL